MHRVVSAQSAFPVQHWEMAVNSQEWLARLQPSTVHTLLSVQSASTAQHPATASCTQAFPTHESDEQGSPSSQSALDRQQPAVVAFEHVPVAVSQVSSVHALSSLQSAALVQHPATAVNVQV